MENQNNQSANKIPAPPPVEIDIRTMESDLRDLKQTGGEVFDTGVKSTYTPNQAQQSQQEVQGYSGPEKPIFPSPESDSARSPGNSLKIILISIAIFAGLIAIGLLGYFVVFPLIFK